MNPFLEPTVAKSEPGAKWHHAALRAKHASRGSAACRLPAGPRGRVLPRRQCPPAAQLSTRSAAIRSTGLALGAIALVSALLLPGVAAAIDVNVATSEQLQEVKGIGPKMARVIIEERQRGGRFGSIEELSERVKGVGAKKAAAMQAAGLVAGSGAAVPAATGAKAAEPAKRAR